MWKYIERGLAVIGVLASVTGAFIAYIALVSPAELSSMLDRIVQRLEVEPVVATLDRHSISSIDSTSEGQIILTINKLATESRGNALLIVCSIESGLKLGEYGYNFNSAPNVTYPLFTTSEVSIRVIHHITDDTEQYLRDEIWVMREGNWSLSQSASRRQAEPIGCDL